MIHFDTVQQDAKVHLKASQEQHPKAWNAFSAKVFGPPPTHVRKSRGDWPVIGLMPTKLSKKRRLELDQDAQQTQKRQRVAQPAMSLVDMMEEEEESEDSEDQT